MLNRMMLREKMQNTATLPYIADAIILATMGEVAVACILCYRCQRSRAAATRKVYAASCICNFYQFHPMSSALPHAFWSLQKCVYVCVTKCCISIKHILTIGYTLRSANKWKCTQYTYPQRSPYQPQRVRYTHSYVFYIDCARLSRGASTQRSHWSWSLAVRLQLSESSASE